MTFLKPCEITQVRQATLSTSSLPRALWEQGACIILRAKRFAKQALGGRRQPSTELALRKLGSVRKGWLGW